VAARHQVNPLSNVVGALVPGDGRMRFCRTNLVDLSPGEWVALSGAYGEEPAQVAFTAEQIEFPDAPTDLPHILRRLSLAEITSLSDIVERAQALMPSLKAIVAQVDPAVVVVGVRFTVAAKTLVCRCSSRGVVAAEALARTLSEQLSLPVEIDGSSVSTASYGSVGRLRSNALDLDATIRARMGLEESDPLASPRLPHLGAVIQTPQGPGVLLSISMRHQSATIRLDSGSETMIPLNDVL
jgi:hypothetical protein